MRWGDSANEDGMRGAFDRSDYIEKIMHPVTEIDISDSAILEHHLCSWCAPSIVSVRGFVIGTAIGFSLDNNSAGQLAVDRRKKPFS